MGENGKVATLVESVAQIAHAFDRLVRLAEDWSDALDLPTFPDSMAPKAGAPKKKRKKRKKGKR